MKLDIGCGNHKDPGWVGMDIQRLPGVDVIHDLNVHPWPIEANSVDQAKAWHIVEHIPPVCVTETGTRRPFLEFMDECWRVLKPGGEAFITVWNRWQPWWGGGRGVDTWWVRGKEAKVPWQTGDETLFRYYYFFSYPELEKLARRAGFQVLRSFPESSYHFPLKLFSRNICLLVKKRT